jgi:hypothetical protein
VTLWGAYKMRSNTKKEKRDKEKRKRNKKKGGEVHLSYAKCNHITKSYL